MFSFAKPTQKKTVFDPLAQAKQTMVSRQPNQSVQPKNNAYSVQSTQAKPTQNRQQVMSSMYKNQPVAATGAKIMRGEGVSAFGIGKLPTLSRTPQASTPQQKPGLQSSQIPASGVGSQYANNQSTQPSTPQQQQAQPQQAQPQQQQQQAPNYLDQYAKAQMELAESQKSQAQKMYEEDLAIQEQMMGLKRDALNAQKGDAQSALEAFRASNQATIGELMASGARQKEAGEQALGTAQRRAAQNKRQTDAQRQQMFANLGTLDSYGAQGFTGQQTNADNEFIRNNANMEAEFARQSSSIDAQVEGAIRQAQQVEQQEVTKYNQLMRQIDSSLAVGSIENQQAKQQAYRTLQENLAGLQEYVNGVQMESAQMKMQMQQQLEQMNASDPYAMLSEQFLATGTPTQQDKVLMMRNPEMAKGYKDIFATGANSQNEQNASEAVDLVDGLLRRDTSKVTGRLRLGGITDPGTTAKTRAEVERLKALLSLAARGQLKGQGNITEGETKMLADAQTSLQYGMSDEDFKQELQRIKKALLPSLSPERQRQTIGGMLGQGQQFDPSQFIIN